MPSTEQVRPITRAPYQASRKSRRVSNTGMPSRDDDSMASEGAHLDRNPIDLSEHALAHDLVDRADPESIGYHERDLLDVVGHFVEGMAHHDHREAGAFVEVAHEG